MENEKSRVPLTTRVYSFGIDFLFIIALQLILGTGTLWYYDLACASYGIATDPEVQSFLSQFCGGFFFLGYFTLSVGLFGNTAGKHYMGIKIINEKTGRPLTLPESYWRAMAYLMSSWTYMIGFIIPWFRADRKALHDLLCGTRVVPSTRSEAQTALPHEPHQFANVHWIQTPTTPADPERARTGTDL
jgi:uncharacterized RDD family membrane protein YckC